jgi:predicted DNA-binding protein with PD1-like motif
MKSKLLHEHDGLRTIAAIFESGDEVMSGVRALAREHRLNGAQITAIGAFSDAVVTYFDWSEKDYLEIPVDEQVEVASLNGDIGVDQQGEPAIHIHLVLGRRDGSAIAGHLKEARVRPTLEMILTETPPHLTRRHDPETGLNLIQL